MNGRNNDEKIAKKKALYMLIMLGAGGGFGFFCLLGRKFYTLGDKTQNWKCVVAGGALLVLAVLAAEFKRTDGGDSKLGRYHFHVCFVLEMLCLAFFLGTAGYFAYSDISHYIMVTKQKDKIQSKLDECMTNMEKMFWDYDGYVKKRKELYKIYLEGLADPNAKKIRWNEYVKVYYDTTGKVSDSAQREELLFKLSTELCPSNYDNIKQISSAWFGEARGAVKNWKSIGILKPIDIVDVVNKVEQKSKEWHDTLTVLSSKHRSNMENAENFVGQLSFDSALGDVRAMFRERGNLKSRLMWTILITLAAVAMMLMYYMRTKYSPRNIVVLGIKKWWKDLWCPVVSEKDKNVVDQINSDNSDDDTVIDYEF